MFRFHSHHASPFIHFIMNSACTQHTAGSVRAAHALGCLHAGVRCHKCHLADVLAVVRFELELKSLLALGAVAPKRWSTLSNPPACHLFGLGAAAAAVSDGYTQERTAYHRAVLKRCSGRKAEGRGQRVEGRGQRAEGRRQGCGCGRSGCTLADRLRFCCSLCCSKPRRIEGFGPIVHWM